jgi:putative ABC transport system ATP-binding protein
MSISAYLDLFVSQGSVYSKQQALTALQLDDDIARLNGGLEAGLSRSGWPLTQPQAIRLKLATALLARPKVLVLGDIVDSVQRHLVLSVLSLLEEQGTTVLYFSNSHDLSNFTHTMEVDSDSQILKSLETSQAGERI